MSMFRSTGITFGSKLLVALVNFAIIILLSRWLGEAGKGRCSQYLLIFSTALILSECISGSTIVYLLEKYSHRQLLLLFYAWSAVAGIFTGVGFWLSGIIPTAEIGWVLLLNWLNAIVSVHQMVALGRPRMHLYNGLNVVQAVLTLVAIPIAFIYGAKEPVAYLWALVAAWGITGMGGFWLVYLAKEQHRFVGWKVLAEAGFRTGIANQTGTFMQLINTRIAYLLLPAAATGIYSNAISLCEACLLINNSIGTVQYNRIAGLAGSNSPQAQIRRQQVVLTQQCFWANGLLMLAALLVLGLIPSAFYAWLFGPAFSQVSYPLRRLLPGIFLYSGFIIIAYFFSGTGRFRLNNYPAGAALLVTLVCYGVAFLTHRNITISLASLITVLSYSTLFLVALLLFFRQEKLTLKQWLKLPGWKERKFFVMKKGT